MMINTHYDLVSPFMIHPNASTTSGLYLPKITLIINGNSKAPGDSMKPISDKFISRRIL